MGVLIARVKASLTDRAGLAGARHRNASPGGPLVEKPRDPLICSPPFGKGRRSVGVLITWGLHPVHPGLASARYR